MWPGTIELMECSIAICERSIAEVPHDRIDRRSAFHERLVDQIDRIHAMAIIVEAGENDARCEHRSKGDRTAGDRREHAAEFLACLWILHGDRLGGLPCAPEVGFKTDRCRQCGGCEARAEITGELKGAAVRIDIGVPVVAALGAITGGEFDRHRLPHEVRQIHAHCGPITIMHVGPELVGDRNETIVVLLGVHIVQSAGIGIPVLIEDPDLETWLFRRGMAGILENNGIAVHEKAVALVDLQRIDQLFGLRAGTLVSQTGAVRPSGRHHGNGPIGVRIGTRPGHDRMPVVHDTHRIGIDRAAPARGTLPVIEVAGFQIGIRATAVLGFRGKGSDQNTENKQELPHGLVGVG